MVALERYCGTWGCALDSLDSLWCGQMHAGVEVGCYINHPTHVATVAIHQSPIVAPAGQRRIFWLVLACAASEHTIGLLSAKSFFTRVSIWYDASCRALQRYMVRLQLDPGHGRKSSVKRDTALYAVYDTRRKSCSLGMPQIDRIVKLQPNGCGVSTIVVATQ